MSKKLPSSRNGKRSNVIEQFINNNNNKKKDFTIQNSRYGGAHFGAYRSFAAACGAFLVAFVASATLVPVKNSSAEEQKIDATVHNANPNLSVTPGQWTVTLDVGQPSSAGTVVTAMDTLTAKANSETGYQLYISMDNNHDGGNRLYKNSDEDAGYISPNHDSSNADIAVGSEAALSENSWGFTTSADKNTNKLYSAVPLLGNEAQIGQREGSATPEEGDKIPIYYAANVNNNMSSGTYSGKILFTIVADDVYGEAGVPSINPQKGNGEVTITLPLQSRISSVSELGTITATIGGLTCPIVGTPTLNGATISLKCTAPMLTHGETYDVAVNIQKYGNTYLASDAFTYQIRYMQEMTSTICANMKTHDTMKLYDSRGTGNGGSNKTTPYGIVKAKDGNCWMTDNLNLYNATISADLSNFNSGTYTIPNVSDTGWSGNIYNEPKAHLVTSTSKSNYSGDKSQYYGQVYYNWTAAVALADGSTTAQQNQSICPKQWQLPIDGTATTDKSWTKLMSSTSAGYGITAGSQLLDPNNAAYALGFRLYYGFWYWSQASEWYQGANGYFWTSTPTSETHARHLNYNASGINPQNNSNKGYGFSIRCVAQ